MSGLWDQPGVPHKGWVCIDIEDLGKPSQICGMCRYQTIRYVHVMRHSEYNGDLEVGCECAAKMENDYASAKVRENFLKSNAKRRANWLKRQWRTSRNGNAYLNTDGYNIVVYSKGGLWGARLVHRVSDRKAFSRKPFKSQDEAKLAAFNQLLLMKAQKPSA